MIFVQNNGVRKAVGAKLSTTSATTLATGTADKRITVESIAWSTDTAGSTFSLWWSDGTSDFYLVKTESESANTRDQITDIHVVLLDGYTLKAQAGTANKIDVTAVIIESAQGR